MLGIRNSFVVAANVVITSSVALITVGLKSAIAAGQTQSLRYFIPFTVGATGGIRAQIVVPAGGVVFNATIKLFNNVAPSLTTSVQAASAAFTNAIANAGTSWLEINLTVINGSTAGDVDLQMAQNTSDPLSLTVLKGGWLDVVKS